MPNELFASMRASASGLHVQSARLRIIAENMANADSMGTVPGEEPYRRKTITFATALDEAGAVRTVEIDRIDVDPTPFRLDYQPGHPAADEAGYVQQPNVNTLIEMVDMREASRSYDANLKMLETSREMMSAALDLLR